MSQLNPDFAERDRLLFGRKINWAADDSGGIERFEWVSAETLKELVAKGYADPGDAQNSSPTLGEFIRFLERFPDVKAHGYAVSPEREDYRVTVEGLQYVGEVGDDLRREFRKLNRHADDFVCTDDELYCWYD